MRAPIWPLVGLLAACSEYSLEKDPVDPDGGVPDITLSPDQVATVTCAAPSAAEVVIRNDGEGLLTLTDVRVEGSGWSMEAMPLPMDLAPGEATLVQLTGTGGAGRLLVESDDPDEPTVSVPLDLALNVAPVVTILTPADGDVLAEGADVELLGAVGDDDDPADTLTLAWTASTSGALCAEPAGGDGLTTCAWAGAGRAGGPQTVTLTATDPCGAIGTASVDVCQDGAYTYESFDLTAWHYEGSAYWDATNAYLVLTEALTTQVGTAFETSAPVNGDLVDIEFQFYIGGGTGADGLSLTALDTTRATTFLGGTGCGIGYGGDAACTAGPALPGWSIEVDTYYNGGQDPTELDHVMFTFDGDVDDPAAWAVLPEIEDTGWHTMRVEVVAPRVRVTIDGVTYIDQDLSGHFTFPAYVGFTAGTGGDTNLHLIDALQVTDYLCD